MGKYKDQPITLTPDLGQAHEICGGFKLVVAEFIPSPQQGQGEIKEMKCCKNHARVHQSQIAEKSVP